ncbi:MAG: hypothetical protein OXT67_01465 [Zetaproteobacteria bacterium]|nr:hypothetical protein [Zetaproteobacteria bacterium]
MQVTISFGPKDIGIALLIAVVWEVLFVCTDPAGFNFLRWAGLFNSFCLVWIVGKDAFTKLRHKA